MGSSNLHLLLLSLLVALLPSAVHPWVAVAPTTGRLKAFSRSTSRRASSQTEDLKDNERLYQRVFYRFSPGSDVDIHNAIVVEERVRFEQDPDRSGYLKAVGPLTLLLRDGQVEDGEIGDDFFTINVHDNMAIHNGVGKLESTIATIMYLASCPDLCSYGKVLELACDIGLASLLGCIGAAFVARRQAGDAGKQSTAVEKEILTVPSTVENEGLLPPNLKGLCLTDSDAERLNFALANAKTSGVSPSKVTIEQLDWSHHVQQPRSGMGMGGSKPPAEFHAIVISDVGLNYPQAKELARTVANRLEPSAPFFALNNPDGSSTVPRFVHVYPDERDDEPYLRKFLEQGYRMATSMGYLKVEKLAFNVQTLPKSESETALDDLELELEDFREHTYASLIAQHDPNYAGGGSGDMFFPMETGEYDNAPGGGTYLEREWDTR